MYIALYVLYIVYQSIVKYILFLHRPLLFIHQLACHSSQYTFITGCLSATTKIQISQLWDFIETWDFCEGLKPIVFSYLSGGPFYVIEAESINGFRISAHF